MHNLRPLVRKTDHAFLAVIACISLARANQQGGQIVQSRLWEALLWRVHNIRGEKSRDSRYVYRSQCLYRRFGQHL